MRNVIMWVLLFVLVSFAVPQAQVAGDADCSGFIDVADLTEMVAYLWMDDPLACPGEADMDDRKRVTIVDFWYLMNDLFWPPGMGLTIPPTNWYDLTVSTADTVWLPEGKCIPAIGGIVSLPVRTKFANNTTAFYLPVEINAHGANINATFSGVTMQPGYPELGAGTAAGGMTGVIRMLSGIDFGRNGIPYAGTQTMFTLDYNLANLPGLFAEIATGKIDVDFDRQFVIEKNLNLYRPVIQYDRIYDYPPADFNCDCVVDIGDLTDLIDFMFITYTPILPCP